MYRKLILCYLAGATVAFSLSLAVHGADKTTDKSVKIVTLSLTPAAEPVPALSYRLLPRYIDQKTGNAALKYYAAAGLYPNRNSKEINENIVKWLDLPFEQLDRKEVEETLSNFSDSFHQIELATRCNSCNWEMPIEDGYTMTIPDLATFRNMIRALQLQIRLKIAEGQIDQALRMMSEGMYMGRCIAEGPTIIQSLVGISIEATMLKEVEQLAQVRDCPNLYWALTSLPDPLIDMHLSLQYEHEGIFVEFPQIRNIENEVLTPEQALGIITDFLNKMQSLVGGSIFDDPFKALVPAGWVMIHYSDAKKYLESKGYSRERIDAMPAVQAVLIFQKQQYMEMADNMFKWLEIPYYQSQPYLQKSEQQQSSFTNQGLKTNLFSILTPALYKVAFVQARLDRNVAMLRTIEAIRMFVAAHPGQLPATLADMTSVPIPSDPVTGKDFLYSRIDAKNARLEAPKAPAEDQNRPVYELSVK